MPLWALEMQKIGPGVPALGPKLGPGVTGAVTGHWPGHRHRLIITMPYISRDWSAHAGAVTGAGTTGLIILRRAVEQNFARLGLSPEWQYIVRPWHDVRRRPAFGVYGHTCRSLQLLTLST